MFCWLCFSEYSTKNTLLLVTEGVCQYSQSQACCFVLPLDVKVISDAIVNTRFLSHFNHCVSPTRQSSSLIGFKELKIIAIALYSTYSTWGGMIIRFSIFPTTFNLTRLHKLRLYHFLVLLRFILSNNSLVYLSQNLHLFTSDMRERLARGGNALLLIYSNSSF